MLVIPDRRQAIRQAIQLARPGDLVLIAGRGHLRQRVMGERRTRFDDAEVARQVLARFGRPTRLWRSAVARAACS
jgi:UDP-N-acetylmuramoyl-L-alanyl-D-glutamate--2,6-diaminopimelate ligase